MPRLARRSAASLLLLLVALSASACNDPAGLPGQPSASPRVVMLASAFEQACALTDSHEVWCWGHGFYGEASDTTVHRKAVPEPLVSLHGASGIFGGQFCGQTASGTVYCWGVLLESDVGASYGDGATPVRMGDFLPGVLATGSGHACALAADSTAQCWGSYVSGKRGVTGPYPLSNTGLAAFTDFTVKPVQGGEQFVALAAGGESTCGIRPDRTLACWGDSSGVGTPGTEYLHDDETCFLAAACIPSPVMVRSFSGVYAVAASGVQTCILGSAGLFCWGGNWAGQLGSADLGAGALPVAVTLPETPVAVTVGAYHTCALSFRGTAWCWGDNSYGALGVGRSGGILGPSRVRFDEPFASISAGGGLTCGLTLAGAVYCWGVTLGPNGWEADPEIRRIRIPLT